jgi:hypothetical protein
MEPSAPGAGAGEEIIGDELGEAGGFQAVVHDGAAGWGYYRRVVGRGSITGNADDEHQVALYG